MMSKLIVEEKDNLLFITLNSPEKRNALDSDLMNELTKIVVEKSKNIGDLKALVLSGEGKSFCAGADLNWMKEMVSYSEAENIEDSKKLFNLFNALYEFPLPVITKAQGHVYGGGLGLLAASDFVLADDKTKFCFSEVKLGLAPSVISSFVLSKCNNSLAQALMTSGIVFNTHKAFHLGLVNESLTDDSYTNLISSITASGQEGLIATKKLCLDQRSLVPSSFKDLTVSVISKLRSSNEAQKRMNHFLDKTSEG